MKDNELILRFLKVADKNNRIVIPDPIVKALGYEYYVEYYKDHIKLIPVKKEK